MIRDYILIIGAMKSGTTALFDLLAQHPEIAPCHPKEPGFFAFEDRWAEGFTWYERLFAFDPAKHKYALDGSTDYTKYPFTSGVAERLAASAPRRFKLIYIIRHPLRRIESHAKHVQISRAEVGSSRSPRKSHSLDIGISPVSMAVSQYHTQLKQFNTYHASGDLIVLTFEELIKAPESIAQRLWQFLNLKPYNVDLSHKLPAQVRRHTPWYWSTITASRTVNVIMKRMLPSTIRNRVRSYLHRPRPIAINGRFTLTPSEEAALWTALRSEYLLMSEQFDVDLYRIWNIPDTV